MGKASSKFRKYLQNGDEYAALQVYECTLELQKNLDPNSSYGDSLKHNTPLHLAAQHAMKSLLKIFLAELKGNPNKKNSDGQVPLHLVCQGELLLNAANQEKRAICLEIILKLGNCFAKADENIKLDEIDNEGNTPLHYAAASGLKKCVEILVSKGASLFIENKSSDTACDLAEKNKHVEIAQYLEAKMLIDTNTTEVSQPVCITKTNEDNGVRGLRDQDLQEAKDQLLVETSDMFHVPLFSAEVLLRNHEWSKQALLDSWMKDPVACCKEAGIEPPSSALKFSSTQDSLRANCEQIQNEYQSQTLNSPTKTVLSMDEKITCGICMLDILPEEFIYIPCTHHFCKDCWQTYLTAKITDGEAHNILCPQFDCSYVVPLDVIERVVSADMIRRYLQFDIKEFVESNPTMKWCPHPGCARAVQLPEPVEKVSEEILAISFSNPPEVSHSVDCGNGHYFCCEEHHR